MKKRSAEPNRWQLHEAKSRFSEVIGRVQAGEPQVITKHGKATAVVLGYDAYRALTGGQRTLAEVLRGDGEEGWDDFVDLVNDRDATPVTAAGFEE